MPATHNQLQPFYRQHTCSLFHITPLGHIQPKQCWWCLPENALLLPAWAANVLSAIPVNVPVGKRWCLHECLSAFLSEVHLCVSRQSLSARPVSPTTTAKRSCSTKVRRPTWTRTGTGLPTGSSPKRTSASLAFSVWDFVRSFCRPSTASRSQLPQVLPCCSRPKARESRQHISHLDASRSSRRAPVAGSGATSSGTAERPVCPRGCAAPAQPPPRRSSILLFPSPAPPPRCPPPPPLRQPPPSPPQKASNGSCLPANMSGHTRRNTAKNVLRLQLAAGSEFGEMHKRPRPVESLLLVLEKVLPQCIPLYAYRGLNHRGSKRLSMLYKHNTISIILYPFLYHPHQHGYSTFQGFTTCYTRPEHSL